MTRRTRWILVLISLALIIAAFVFLGYALWSPGSLREVVPLAPTLFAPPQTP